jgi:hypothetical protein
MDFFSPPEYVITLCSYCNHYMRDYMTKDIGEPVYCSDDCADAVLASLEEVPLMEATPITAVQGDFEFRADDSLLDGHLLASEMLRALI